MSAGEDKTGGSGVLQTMGADQVPQVVLHSAHGWGACVNTLLARKRYAVRHLRERLQKVYDEFTRK